MLSLHLLKLANARINRYRRPFFIALRTLWTFNGIVSWLTFFLDANMLFAGSIVWELLESDSRSPKCCDCWFGRVLLRLLLLLLQLPPDARPPTAEITILWLLELLLVIGVACFCRSSSTMIYEQEQWRLWLIFNPMHSNSNGGSQIYFSFVVVVVV